MRSAEEAAAGGGRVETRGEAEMQQLVLQLARAVLPRAPLPHTLASSGAVLLHREVDGVRCLLLRVGGESDGVVATLSVREREIAEMVAAGHTTAGIARTLGISTFTVSTHLRRSFAKLGVRTRAELVARLLDR